MRYKQEELWFPLSENILGWDKDFHDLMLNDASRMSAYEKAIKETIKEGMIVADIGTGTGILAQWALEAGAAKVYGIEANKNILPLALKRMESAGFSQKFIPILGFSYDVGLPERVDAIISELLGNLGDNEDMTPILADARKRFLKDHGVTMPSKVTSFIVPVDSRKLHLQVKEKRCHGISEKYNLNRLLSKLQTKNPFDLYYDAIIPKRSHLSFPQPIQTFTFSADDKATYRIENTFTINAYGVFVGFKGYCIAELSQRVHWDTSGDEVEKRATSDCLKHCFLPIEIPLEVKKGDVIHLAFSRTYPVNNNAPFRQCYAWEGFLQRKGKKISTFHQEMCRR